MKPYEFLDHTSEAKFRAYGKTLEEAFENSAKALFVLMVDIHKINSNVKHKVEVKGEDLKSLLFDFLEELIILKDSDGFLLKEVKVSLDKDNYKLVAECSGDKIGEYETGADVKAMTYDDMLVEENEDGFVVQVVVDV